jgi:hypothetical protein
MARDMAPNSFFSVHFFLISALHDDWSWFNLGGEKRGSPEFGGQLPLWCGGEASQVFILYCSGPLFSART